MSMDVAVWSPVDIALPEHLPRSEQWQAYDHEWVYDGESWQILIAPGDDTPKPEVLDKLPNASRVYYVSLAPIGAEPEGYALLEEVARALAEHSGGVWVDPFNGVYSFDEG